MFKLNNKGFAISVILYSVVLLMISVMYLLVTILNSRYKMNKDLKNNVTDYVNTQGVNTVDNEYLNQIATNKLLVETTQASNGNRYYTGNNPNNYVLFSNNIWRIIGLIKMDDVYYVKMINMNNNELFTLDNNIIRESNLLNRLNSIHSEFETKYLSYIKDIKWKNCEFSTNITPSVAYNNEKNCTNTFTSYVGIVSSSDFGYTANPEFLNNNLNNYSVSINDNWLSTTNRYFTLSYSLDKINVVSETGNLTTTDNMEAYIYPVIYLKAKIRIISGNGTFSSPYKLAE